jgi:AGCS family alanine or glycine:cation symporter
LQQIEAILLYLDSVLGAAQWFPFLLLGTGVYFSVYLKFPQVRYFAHAWKVLRGKFDKADDPGDTSHFQALSTALSGTVGTGNIGGVAFALFLGGPAALFWMWMTAVFGMTSKFVEVTLSYKYREVDAQGHMSGGPMYFMERGLNMKWLAVFFAGATVISSFGTGNLPQSNNIAQGLENSFSIPPWVSGLCLAILLGLVIIGGIKRIAKVTSTLVPVMGVLYTIGALAVIAFNYENIGPSFVAVFRDAFTGSAATGGFLGASFAYAFNRGVNRGLFSNEAGQGSAPMAHAAARGREPVSEGMVSLLEPFLDTIIICSLTGMAILASGVWSEKFENTFESSAMEFVSGQFSDDSVNDREHLARHLDFFPPVDDPVQPYSGTIDLTGGKIVSADLTVIHNRSIAEDVHFYRQDTPIEGPVVVEQGRLVDGSVVVVGKSLVHSVTLTNHAFTKSMFGRYGEYIVSVGLLLFAFSTAVAWSYYGDRAVTYLFGAGWVGLYRAFYVVAFFLAAIVDTALVWQLSAVTLALMTIPNLIGILLLRREMKETVNQYWADFEREKG